MGSGDIISQTIIEKKQFKKIEMIRVARFTFLGTFMVGPVLKTWYTVLEKFVGVKGATSGLKKMLLDQTVFAPIFLINFVTIMGILQNETSTEIKKRIQRDYVTILMSNYKLWPTVQLFTFYVIPFQFRVIFVNVVAIFWNSYLSWKSNRKNLHGEIKEISQ
ncbi:protein Mpv17-like [Centruroides sculpturatus]|uniref:protein Mpv17-like n=1 Tax=Centruroides sculpturatus TaxID=218467 RepID=UPI000C6D3D68|nr:protein Mpv17-like [Centruroides sculpturatus]XP_023231110.1 protein Mpv17-like [Centruroides sculpturatus]